MTDHDDKLRRARYSLKVAEERLAGWHRKAKLAQTKIKKWTRTVKRRQHQFTIRRLA